MRSYLNSFFHHPQGGIGIRFRLIYALLKGSLPIILTNASTFLLAVMVLWLKILEVRSSKD